MLLFFCYCSRDVNRLLGEVIDRERAAGGDGVAVGIGRPPYDELRSLGIESVLLSVDEPLAAEPEAEVEARCRQLLAGEGGPFHGVDLWPLVEASLAVTSATHDDYGAHAQVRAMLRGVLRSHELFEALSPRVVVIWNGSVGIPAVVAAVARARGLALCFLERGPLPGLMQIDTRGINGGASIARERTGEADEAARDWCRSVVADLAAAPDESEVKRMLAAAGVSSTERIALFVDTQLPPDLRLGPPQEDVYHSLASAYSRSESPRLVVKSHPLDRNGRGRVIPSILPGSIHVSGGAMRAWLERASHVVTVDSSAGLQAALLGRPVILLGPASYGGPGTVAKGITVDVASGTELAEAVRRVSASSVPDLRTARAASDFVSGWRARGGIYRTSGDREAERLRDWLAQHARGAVSPSSIAGGVRRLLQAREDYVARLEGELADLRPRSSRLAAIEDHAAAPSLRALGRVLALVGRVRGLRSLAAVLELARRVGPRAAGGG